MSNASPPLLSPTHAGLSGATAAAVTRVPIRAVMAPVRGNAAAARARQLAIYLQHVALGSSLSACARQFRRDRATVRHACAVIENLREDSGFDRCMVPLAKALAAHRDMLATLAATVEGAAQ